MAKPIDNYDITLEVPLGDKETPGLQQIAFTHDPAVVVKGVAYKSLIEKMSYSDDLKYRITAPVMIPMSIYRKDEEDEGNGKGYEYNTNFTPEVIDELHAKFMKDLQGKGDIEIKDVYNLNHDDKKTVPAYVLEAWIVDNPDTDKAFQTYGIKVPKGTLMMTAQVTDKAYYHELVKKGVTGFSIEGYLGMKKCEYNAEPKEYGDCIIYNAEGEILLLQRTEGDTIEPGKWCLPGGKIEPGELPQQGAIREAYEETGLQPETEGNSVQHADTIVNKDGSRSHYYIFTPEQYQDVVLSSEHVAFAWVKPESVEEKEIIFGNAERFKSLFKKVNNKSENSMKEGEKFQVENGDWYVVLNGVPTKCDAEGKPVEMATETEEETTEEETTTTETENADETATETTTETETETAGAADADLEKKVLAIVEPKIDEVIALIAEVKSMIPASAQTETTDQNTQMSDGKKSYASILNFMNQKAN